MSGAPARSSASSARRRCARRSISPKRRSGLEIAMLSATERSGTSESSWKMQTMPARLDADAELDAAVGLHAGVAVDEASLHLNRAAHRVDHTAKLNDAAVPGALDDAPAVGGDGGV